MAKLSRESVEEASESVRDDPEPPQEVIGRFEADRWKDMRFNIILAIVFIAISLSCFLVGILGKDRIWKIMTYGGGAVFLFYAIGFVIHTFQKASRDFVHVQDNPQNLVRNFYQALLEDDSSMRRAYSCLAPAARSGRICADVGRFMNAWMQTRNIISEGDATKRYSIFVGIPVVTSNEPKVKSYDCTVEVGERAWVFSATAVKGKQKWYIANGEPDYQRW